MAHVPDATTPPLQPAAPRRRRAVLLATVAVFAVVLLVRFPHAQHTYQPDDAYITYRYAANLAAGRGFVYNRGDHTLGTTSPLLTLVLAIPAALKLDVPTVAGALSMTAAALCCAVVFEMLWFASGSVFGGLAGALLLAVSPLQAYIAASGMEPALLCLLLASSLSCLLRGNVRLGAMLAGLAAIGRPEGMFWLPLTVVLLRRESRWDWRAVLALLLPPVLWTLFATAYFGSPLPHSMFAKLAQGRLGGQLLGGVLARVLSGSGVNLPALGLALVGAWCAARTQPRLLLAVAYAILFVGAYALTRPAFYYWYPAPLELCLAIMIGFGVGAAAKKLARLEPARLALGREGPPVALLAVFVIMMVPRVASFDIAWESLVPRNSYLADAQWLKTHSTPSDRVLIGDIGYVGYYNPDMALYDYYGLVWTTPTDAQSQPLSPQIRGDIITRMAHLVQPTIILMEGGRAPLVAPRGFRRVPTPPEVGRAAFVRLP